MQHPSQACGWFYVLVDKKQAWSRTGVASEMLAFRSMQLGCVYGVVDLYFLIRVPGICLVCVWCVCRYRLAKAALMQGKSSEAERRIVSPFF